MKRRILTGLATLSILTAVFTATAPVAAADRDTGWHDHTCTTSAGHVTVDIRVIWYTARPNNPAHRFWEMFTYARDNSGRIHPVDIANWWTATVDGTWLLVRHQTYPDPYTTQWVVYQPKVRPGEAHRFKNIVTWRGYRCPSATVLN
jgi:hypothetical protein